MRSNAKAWSAEYRCELQWLMKDEGVYSLAVDGNTDGRRRHDCLAAAARAAHDFDAFICQRGGRCGTARSRGHSMIPDTKPAGIRIAAAALLMLGAGLPSAVSADEIGVLSASAVKTVLTDLADGFRRESGHGVKLTFATAGEVEKRVLAGDAAHVVIGTDASTEKLAGQGLLVADTRAVIARVGVGVGVREGAAKPDITSADALKRMLLEVKSVTYPDPARGGASGIHFAKVIEQLGIAQPVKEKSVLGANPDFVCVAVAKGEVELCVHQISEILPVKGVTLVGPLPREVPRVTTFAIALSSHAGTSQAARAFVAFVTRPAFRAKFADAGLDYRPD
jgi:molybdate transport system substrate-binding protein